MSLILVVYIVSETSLHSPIQVASAPFSLEHPNQFYLESRKIRGGIKEECKVENSTVNVDTDFDLSEKDLTELECMDTL